MRVVRINSMYDNPVEIKSDYLRAFNVKSLEAIKNIATYKQLDLFINVSTNTKRLQDKLTLMALATKNNSVSRGAAISHINNNMSMEELSVRVYNVSMMAIEALNNKIKHIKI